jgi:hypothetical protein
MTISSHVYKFLKAAFKVDRRLFCFCPSPYKINEFAHCKLSLKYKKVLRWWIIDLIGALSVMLLPKNINAVGSKKCEKETNSESGLLSKQCNLIHLT